jgi:hypothetical protein
VLKPPSETRLPTGVGHAVTVTSEVRNVTEVDVEVVDIVLTVIEVTGIEETIVRVVVFH